MLQSTRHSLALKAILAIALTIVIFPALTMLILTLYPNLPLLYKRLCWVTTATLIYLTSIVVLYRYFLGSLSPDLKQRAIRMFKVCSALLGLFILFLWILLFL